MEVVIEHDEELCGPCKLRYHEICYLFGKLSETKLVKDGIFIRPDVRHPMCVRHAITVEAPA